MVALVCSALFRESNASLLLCKFSCHSSFCKGWTAVDVQQKQDHNVPHAPCFDERGIHRRAELYMHIVHVIRYVIRYPMLLGECLTYVL